MSTNEASIVLPLDIDSAVKQLVWPDRATTKQCLVHRRANVLRHRPRPRVCLGFAQGKREGLLATGSTVGEVAGRPKYRASAKSSVKNALKSSNPSSRRVTAVAEAEHGPDSDAGYCVCDVETVASPVSGDTILDDDERR